MSDLFAWVIIIVVLLLILILLRKFLKRLIFIVILLLVAFFIYRLFSPVGASRVWYEVKTFPQWVASFLGGEEVLPFEIPPVVKRLGKSVRVAPKRELPHMQFLEKEVEVQPEIETILEPERERELESEKPFEPEPVFVPARTEQKEVTPVLVDGLTAQEIRETEQLFGLLLH
jgi:hypothetical protein